MDKTKKRRPLESISQWRNRLILNNRKKALNYEGELEPAVVIASDPRKSINQGTRLLGSKPNNYRVGQKSLFGQRKNRDTNTLGRRMINWFTDKTHLTSPPTYTDGYGRELNAEVPIDESAQGQELERMKDTAKTGMEIAMSATLPFGMVLEPIATPLALGAGAGTYAVVKKGLNELNSNLEEKKGVSIHPKILDTVSTAASFATGAPAKRYGDAVTRRGLELIMHESPAANPAPEVQNWWKNASWKNKTDAIKYVLTGKGNGFLANKHNYPNYSGFMDYGQNTTGRDAVRTYLYKEPFGKFREVQNPDYGVHADYILKNYPGKDIKVYESSSPNILDVGYNYKLPSSKPQSMSTKGIDGSMKITDETGSSSLYDSAGHIIEKGLVPEEGWFTREQDIYKFNPKDYYKKWMSKNKGTGWISKLPLKWGLNVVDHYGTPFIVRTPWSQGMTPISNNPMENFNLGHFELKDKGFNVNAENEGLDFNVDNIVTIPESWKSSKEINILNSPDFSEFISSLLSKY